MDNVTHTLVGLMMSRVMFPRPTRRAPLMMMISANLPDIDVVSLLWGSVTYLEYHRGATHSLIAAPLLALLPVLLVRERRAMAYLASLAAIFSHLLLDWTNSYGIRLFLPFSSRWPRLDITSVVDPWILAILFLALLAPMLVGLVTSEIGGRRSGGARLGWACFALLALLSYEGARYTAHARALAIMSARLYNGVAARTLAAIPTTANLFLWHGVAEAPGFVATFPVDLLGRFDPTAARIAYDPPPSPAIDAARATRPFQVFGRFDQLPFWRVLPASEGTEVDLLDLRFGTPEGPGFEARALVDSSGRVHDSIFTFGMR